MPHMMFHGKVDDYAKWRSVFDENATMRKGFGSKGGSILQSAGDPNEVVVLLEWDTLEQAQTFARSDELREAMRKAGLVGAPTIVFLNEVGRPES